MEKALKRAIKKAGGGSALARALNVDRRQVFQWKRAQPQHVLQIESLTGISRHELRPDIFGKKP